MQVYKCWATAAVIWTALGSLAAAKTGDVAYRPGGYFDELVHYEVMEPGVRVYVNAPADEEASRDKPTRLILFALPNGNTIEQTLGCRMKPGLDWHYDIQHIAAQVRMLRELAPGERIVLVCLEAPGRTWPAFRTTYKEDGNARIGQIFDKCVSRFGGEDCRVTLTGHSGGGSFDFGVIESHEEIPATIDRIAFLDSNYAFDAKHHLDKLAKWLRGADDRRLVVIAYDDREIMFDGKKVVGPDGGTYRATGRMDDALSPLFPLVKGELAGGAGAKFITHKGLDGRIQFFVHPNPENKILHTALVGDMNGLLQAQTLGTPLEAKWGAFGGPRAYSKWIQAEPTVIEEGNEAAKPKDAAASPSHERRVSEFPPRKADAMSGSAFCRRVADVPLTEREALILNEITAGNFPEFERRFVKVPVTASAPDGKTIACEIETMPDYLAVGGDDDFVRMPMRPQTAQMIADRFGCLLPTRKLVDAIDAAAMVRLAPQPLTENREAVSAFVLENDKIEAEWKLRSTLPHGSLVTGAKKDIILSPLIYDRKPQRLVIYGWRQLDGRPIQPVTNVHWDRYVDYSHGVRLVKNAVTVDGKVRRIDELLADPQLSAIVSDEGVFTRPRYPED